MLFHQNETHTRRPSTTQFIQLLTGRWPDIHQHYTTNSCNAHILSDMPSPNSNIQTTQRLHSIYSENIPFVHPKRFNHTINVTGTILFLTYRKHSKVNTVCNANKWLIPSVTPKSSIFPHWFSNLSFIILRRETTVKKYMISNSDYNYDIFQCYGKLVKITMKADRVIWLKTTDENLRTQPKRFSKVCSYI